MFAYLGKTEEEPQTKQLEFEDVWLASQVEPLQDNFDILGRFALGQTIRQEGHSCGRRRRRCCLSSLMICRLHD